MKEHHQETFEYTYSAKQQNEIESIRRKYLPKEDDKMTLLRKLDKDATKPGLICSLALGVIGSFLLGIGMCCSLVWADSFFVLGIILGIPGIILMAIAYPVYNKITIREREKIAPQILALTEELSKV